MGYRSNGKLYMKENVYKLVPTALLIELAEDWEKDDLTFEEDGYIIYSFYDWKWYAEYEDVIAWNDFFSDLRNNETIREEDWDFIVVGEDGAVIEHRTQEHFYISSSIKLIPRDTK
jgi:hypothetical protein